MDNSIAIDAIRSISETERREIVQHVWHDHGTFLESQADYTVDELTELHDQDHANNGNAAHV